jgi:hypothetical protein
MKIVKLIELKMETKKDMLKQIDCCKDENFHE